VDWARRRDQAIVALVGLVFVAVFLWLIGHIIGVVALVAIAVVFALALEPLMVRAERYMPRLLAAAAVYILVLGGLSVLGWVLWPPLLHQANELARQLPGYASQADQLLVNEGPRFGVRVPSGTVTRFIQQAAQNATGGAPETVALELINVAGRIAEALADIVLVLVLAFYFMVDGRRMRAGAARLFPSEQQPKVRFVEDTISLVLGAYVRSQLVMAGLMAISAGVGCALLGVKYPVVIGALAFLAELVPLVGPFLAAIPAMLIAIFQSFGLMVEVTFFFVIMQMFENNVIRPRITGPMVGLHPVEALLALVVGGVAAGLWGALFAVPAVGIAVVLLTVIFKAWRGEPIEFERRGMRVKMRRTTERAPPRRPRHGPEPPPSVEVEPVDERSGAEGWPPEDEPDDEPAEPSVPPRRSRP
jgi:predicted PurR-regulated permease PerM